MRRIRVIERLATGSEVVTILIMVTLTPFVSCPMNGTVVVIRESLSLFLIVCVGGTAVGIGGCRRGVGFPRGVFTLTLFPVALFVLLSLQDVCLLLLIDHVGLEDFQGSGMQTFPLLMKLVRHFIGMAK